MSNDARDIEWRCGCGQSNPDFSGSCVGCGQERYPKKDVPLVISGGQYIGRTAKRPTTLTGHGVKRPAEYVPQPVRGDLNKLSKASLLELVWDYAREGTGGDESSDAKAYADIEQRATTIANLTGARVSLKQRSKREV